MEVTQAFAILDSLTAAALRNGVFTTLSEAMAVNEAISTIRIAIEAGKAENQGDKSQPIT